MKTIAFFTSPLCGACEEWKPTVEAFASKLAGRAFVLRLNPNLRAYEYLKDDGSKWKVKYTPSAMVTENGKLLRYIEGRLLDEGELEDFVFNDEWKPPWNAKHGASEVEEGDDEEEEDEEEDEEDE